MGGQGSGGSNRLSDAEKKARGTFRPDHSDEVYNAQQAAKILQGPWLNEVPEPDYPLNEFGRAAYDGWTRLMLEQGKLTKVAASLAGLAAVLKQKIKGRLETGKSVSTDDIKTLARLEADMGVAENAPVIGNKPERSRFADAGFANKRTPTFRLR